MVRFRALGSKDMSLMDSIAPIAGKYVTLALVSFSRRSPMYYHAPNNAARTFSVACSNPRFVELGQIGVRLLGRFGVGCHILVMCLVWLKRGPPF